MVEIVFKVRNFAEFINYKHSDALFDFNILANCRFMPRFRWERKSVSAVMPPFLDVTIPTEPYRCSLLLMTFHGGVQKKV
jgi:hypothetical protein